MMKSSSYVEGRDLEYNAINAQENEIRTLINPDPEFLQYCTKRFNVKIKTEVIEELNIALTVFCLFQNSNVEIFIHSNAKLQRRTVFA